MREIQIGGWSPLVAGGGTDLPSVGNKTCISFPNVAFWGGLGMFKT